MAMVAPQVVNDVKSQWYGAGGSSVLGYSNIPTIGIIPQPDYLWWVLTSSVLKKASKTKNNDVTGLP